jgi:hypothetical protein
MSDNPLITSSTLFTRYILPFLLVFVISFAILLKTKLFGDDKKQINLIVSLIMGLIFISFDYATDIVVKLIPFLIVCLVILFVFMLIYGFIAVKKGSDDILNGGLRIALGIIFGIAVIGAVFWATGIWKTLYTYFSTSSSSGSIFVNVLFIALVGGGIAIVLASGGGGGKSGSG